MPRAKLLIDSFDDMKAGTIWPVINECPRDGRSTLYGLDHHGAMASFTSREVEIIPDPVVKAKHKRGQFRVSAFALGVTDLHAACAKYQTFADEAIAQDHFAKLKVEVGKSFEMVLLHRGNLQGVNFKVLNIAKRAWTP